MEVSRVELYDGTALYAEVLDTMTNFGFRALKRRVGRVSGNCLFQNQKYTAIN
jgi:tryptophan 2,3-dioxygenase